MLLLLQLVVTSRIADPVLRFKSAVFRLWTVGLIGLIAYAAIVGDYGHTQKSSPNNDRLLVTSLLTGAQIVIAVALLSAIMALKRRPAVFRPDGKLVDRQMNSTLWSRYAFSWSNDVLSAAAKDTFQHSELPAMDHTARSEKVTARFKDIVLKGEKLPLWVQLSWAYRNPLAYQWISILISNFFDVAPAFATLQLLQYLEARKDVNDLDPWAWKYVLGIAVATTSSHLIDSRISWSRGSGNLSLFLSTG